MASVQFYLVSYLTFLKRFLSEFGLTVGVSRKNGVLLAKEPCRQVVKEIWRKVIPKLLKKSKPKTMASKEKMGKKNWIETNASDEMNPEVLGKIWDVTDVYKNSVNPDLENGLSKFRAKIQNQPLDRTPKMVRVQFSPLLKIAAAVAILLVAWLWVKDRFDFKNNLEKVTAEAGQKTKIGLEDGSMVVLNEKSSLAFPEKFGNKERRISLEGEAFFQVAKDLQRPFTVEIAEAEVQVLGTEFNVRAYPSEDFLEVYVQSGKVAVLLKEADETVELLPGEKLVFKQKAGKKIKSRDENGNAAAWNTGKIRFKKTPMKEVFASFERLFGISILIADNQISDCPYTHSFDINQWKDVLRAMEKTCPLKVSETSPGNFVVSGQCCGQTN